MPKAKLQNEATLGPEELDRKNKIDYLERAVYEYLQRVSYYNKMIPKYESICNVALKLRDIIQIENFKLNKNWINNFKIRYKFNLSQGMLLTDRVPPSSCDLHDILLYCSNERDHLTKNVVETNDNSDDNVIIMETQPEIITIEDDDESSFKDAKDENDKNESDEDVIILETKTEIITICDED